MARAGKMRPKDASYRHVNNETSLTAPAIDNLLASVVDALAQYKQPAVTGYDVGHLVFALTPHESAVDYKQLYREYLERLLRLHLLSPIGSSNSVTGYLLFGKTRALPAEIVCSLDPFAYVSHLSAMEYHGLTDRFPKTLYMCTPPAKEWRAQALERMQRDLSGNFERYRQTGLPRLTRPNVTLIGHTSVQFHELSQMVAFRNVPDSPVKVATLGRVFLDMLREPGLCGGIQHVLDIYRREAKRYLRLIVDEVDRHGRPIDKVRAGYVLSEVCHLSNEAITAWAVLAQRGGSRRLDPDSGYASAYSDRWQLSLNVPSLENIDDDTDAE